MTDTRSEIEEYTRSSEFMDTVRDGLGLNDQLAENSQNKSFIASLKNTLGINSLSTQVNKPEPPESKVEDFDWKGEHGYGKGEYVGAVGTAYGASGAATGLATSVTGVGAEATGAGFGFKIFNMEKNLLNDIWADLTRTSPEKLREDVVGLQFRVDKVDRELGKNVDLAKLAHTRINTLARDLNQKLKKKADKSDVGRMNTRQNSQLAGLDRATDRARVEIRRLYDEVARLEGRF